MLTSTQYNHNQIQRFLSDMFEPFAVKFLQKKYHSFFVYRCEQYQSFQDFCKCERWVCNINKDFQQVIEKYWKSIDVIYCKTALPEYTATKEYFSQLYRIRKKVKILQDIEIFEIKVSKNTYKPIISCNCHDLATVLSEKFRKKLLIVKINLSGSLDFSITQKEYEKSEFHIKTHYGRLNKTIKK